MDPEDVNDTVDIMLQITSTSASQLHGSTCHDSWWQTAIDNDSESFHHATSADLEAILRQDIDDLKQRRSQMESVQRRLEQEPDLYEKIKGETNHRLEKLGYTASDLKALSVPERLLRLSRAVAGLERPGDQPRPSVSRQFVVHVAHQYFVANKGYNVRTLYFPQGVSWTDFHRSLQDLTTNWQVNAELGCPGGLSPENGMWLYGIRSSSKTIMSDGTLEDALDGPETFAELKERLLCPSGNERKLAAILVHVGGVESRVGWIHADIGTRTNSKAIEKGQLKITPRCAIGLVELVTAQCARMGIYLRKHSTLRIMFSDSATDKAKSKIQEVTPRSQQIES